MRPDPIHLLHDPPETDLRDDEGNEDWDNYIRTTNITPGSIHFAWDPADPDGSGLYLVLTNYYRGNAQSDAGLTNVENRLKITVGHPQYDGQQITAPVTRGDLLNMAQVFLAAAMDPRNW